MDKKILVTFATCWGKEQKQGECGRQLRRNISFCIVFIFCKCEFTFCEEITSLMQISFSLPLGLWLLLQPAGFSPTSHTHTHTHIGECLSQPHIIIKNPGNYQETLIQRVLALCRQCHHPTGVKQQSYDHPLPSP